MPTKYERLQRSCVPSGSMGSAAARRKIKSSRRNFSGYRRPSASFRSLSRFLGLFTRTITSFILTTRSSTGFLRPQVDKEGPGIVSSRHAPSFPPSLSFSSLFLAFLLFPLFCCRFYPSHCVNRVSPEDQDASRFNSRPFEAREAIYLTELPPS